MAKKKLGPDVASERDPLRYPVTSDWLERVNAVLERRGWGSKERLADAVDVKSGKIAELLTGKKQTSELVAGVHDFLEWAPPLSPLACADLGGLLALLNKLPPSTRNSMEAALRELTSGNDADVRKAFEGMLAVLGSRRKTV